MNLFIFPRIVSSFGPFCSSISCVFSCTKSRETIAPLKKQKDFFNFFPTSSTDFKKGVPLLPMYTQFDPGSPNPPKNRQRVATPKMRKPGLKPGSKPNCGPQAPSPAIFNLVWYSHPGCEHLYLGKHRRPRLPRAPQPHSFPFSWTGFIPFLGSISYMQIKYESTLPYSLNNLIRSNKNSTTLCRGIGEERSFTGPRKCSLSDLSS